MCELLGVSASGYFAWSRDRELTDAWLTERIRRIHAASGGRYGSPRVHAMLAREGIGVGRKRVERLMRAAGLQGAFRRRRRGCTVRIEGVEPFGDLVGRDFRPTPRIACGLRTSSRSRPGRAGCTWPRCRICSAAGSSAGASPRACALSSSSTRCRSGSQLTDRYGVPVARPRRPPREHLEACGRRSGTGIRAVLAR